MRQPKTDKPTIQDVVNGTPKGLKAVDKAVKRSIQVQNDMTAKAKTTRLVELTQKDKERKK